MAHPVFQKIHRISFQVPRPPEQVVLPQTPLVIQLLNLLNSEPLTLFTIFISNVFKLGVLFPTLSIKSHNHFAHVNLIHPQNSLQNNGYVGFFEDFAVRGLLEGFVFFEVAAGGAPAAGICFGDGEPFGKVGGGFEHVSTHD